MKKLLLLIVLSLLVSCDDEIETTRTESEENSYLKFEYLKFWYGTTDEYHIQEIDGCEYILVNGRENSEPALTHKGNCKYCVERNKKTVEVVKEIKEGWE
jgi:hypothetical protein